MHRTYNAAQNWEVENAWVSRKLLMIIVDCWLLALDLSEGTGDFAVCSWSRATGYQTPNIIDCILRQIELMTHIRRDTHGRAVCTFRVCPSVRQVINGCVIASYLGDCGTVFDLRCCSFGRTWRVSCQQQNDWRRWFSSSGLVITRVAQRVFEMRYG